MTPDSVTQAWHEQATRSLDAMHERAVRAEDANDRAVTELCVLAEEQDDSALADRIWSIAHELERAKRT